jgi:hypothetical protein
MNYLEFSGNEYSGYINQDSDINIQGVLKMTAAWGSDKRGHSLAPHSLLTT